MGTQKMTAKMIFASILFSLVSVVVASESNAMPTNHKLSTLEAQDGCAECQAAVYRDNGLEKTRSELLHLAGLISADGRDPREVQKQDGSRPEFMPIGLVYSKKAIPGSDEKGRKYSQAAGTAFLISPCLIMTNNHVVLNDRLSPLGTADDYLMTFEVGAEGQPGHASVTARPKNSGHFGSGYNISDDWAILELERDTKTHQCLGEKLGWFNLAKAPLNKDDHTTYTSAGFSVDKARGLAVQKQCSVMQTLDKDRLYRLLTTCATLPGNSGGPVLKMVPGSAPTVVAMTTQSADQTTVPKPEMNINNRNTAFDIYSYLSDVDDLAADIAKDLAGKQNPLEHGMQLSSARL